ncbi:MAG: hypothetical protein KGN78_13645 [Actinomycetales bacterium]|nr:hypothetical protein [Actinomycetales bacterium]
MTTPDGGYVMGAGPQRVDALADVWYDLDAVDTDCSTCPEEIWHRGHFEAGCIRDAVPFWKEHVLPGSGADARTRKRISSWLEYGVTAQEFFRSYTGVWRRRERFHATAEPPKGHREPNHIAPGRDMEFAVRQVDELIALRCLVKVEQQPHLVMPLGVAENPGSGKLRLIYDAQFLNLWCQADKPNYEGLRKFIRGVARGDQMWSADHKSGYHHVPIHPGSQGYFGVEWKGAFYVWTVLPFGWNSACFVYATITTTLAAFARGRGKHVTVYLDDFAWAVPKSLPPMARKREVVLSANLQYLAGFVLSMEKSLFDPTWLLPLLGFLVNSAEERYEVPEAKWQKILLLLNEVLAAEVTQGRVLEKLLGKLQALAIAVPCISMFLWEARDALALAKARGGAAAGVALPDLAKHDLQDLAVGMAGWSRLAKWRSERHMRLDTDACKVTREDVPSGWGAALYMGDTSMTASGVWTIEEAESLTIYELEAIAVVRAIVKLAAHIRDCILDLYTDNEGVRYTILRGKSLARCATLRTVSRELLQWQLENNFVVRVHRVSTTENVVADTLSRGGLTTPTTRANFRLAEATFAGLVSWVRAGGNEFTVDACATSQNHQLPRFIADPYGPTDGSLATDALMYTYPPQGGKREFVYCYPPWQLVYGLWRHFRLQRVAGVMLVPLDPGQPWYGTVIAGAAEVRTLVHKGTDGHILQRDAAGSWIPASPPTHHILAVRFDHGEQGESNE